jgi:hypothetical protein
MPTAIITLFSNGQVVILRAIRNELYWQRDQLFQPLRAT